MNKQVGNRWFKCDLHLHSMSSECYRDKNDTPKDWVDRAVQQGLDLVAVTDHNSYRGIDAIAAEAKLQGLHVFPGVEITCDTSKIHLLVLFDIHKDSEAVRDFLSRCDIYGDMIGRSEGTSMNVFEVCEIARKHGAMVIASHIDEFNSINSMTPSNLDEILNPKYIDAVQVVNAEYWNKYNQDRNAEEMNRSLAEKYGPDATPEEIDRWRKCYNRALAAGIPMLTFSDNPCAPGKSKHGLWGIGSCYTWIQMDNSVDFESLHQAFVSPGSRIRTMYDSPEKPDNEPDFWIRSLEVRASMLNPHVPIHLDFHPQLNCIIGGRGSGKSAIINLLFAAYRQFPIGVLKGMFSSIEEFYKATDEAEMGIFNDASEIEIRFKWYGSEYRLLISEIKGVDQQKYTLFMTDPDSGEEKEMPLGAEFFVLMAPSVIPQGMINGIAATQGALLESVDLSIAGMHVLQCEKQNCLDRLIFNYMEIDSARAVLEKEEGVNYSINWMKKLPQDNKFNIDSIRNTQAALKRMEHSAMFIEQTKKHVVELLEEQKRLTEAYEQYDTEIRKIRGVLLKEVLAEDANYKMELVPFASRQSFYRILEAILKCDLLMISDDIRILENALFAKNDGLAKYAKLLKDVRHYDMTGAQACVSGELGFSEYFTRLVQGISSMDYHRLLLFRPEDEVKMFYHPNGVKRFFPMDKASLGEKAAAVLSLLLFANTEPLVIDHPEDNIDNRIVYEEVVSKIKKVKNKRQLILVTHNANIATATDAELITVMDSKSKFVRVKMQNAIDDQDVRVEICEALEGSIDAFRIRAKKYHIEG